MSIDVRTRIEADVEFIDPVEFFGDELPRMGIDRGVLAAPGARELDVEPFSIVTPAGAWTLALVGEVVTVTPGDQGTAAVRCSVIDVSDVLNDLKTPMTFVAGGTLDMVRGNLGDFLDWWVVLRSLIDAVPVHTSGSIKFRDLRGDPLDLGRSFTPDDDDSDIAHFLAEAGFLHLRGWYSPDVMSEIANDIDDALPSYARDDGHSWWARTADGQDRCVRLQDFDEHSIATTQLVDGDEIARVAALSGDGHLIPGGSNRVEALVKPVGVVEGISDVPWHKDCSLGMHSFRCNSLTIGVSVTGADARSGQLRVVPGSHRTLVQPAFVRREWGLPIQDLSTEVGDMTVHCSCMLHMAQPPMDRERKVLYTGVRLPQLDDGGNSDGASIISLVREGAYNKVSQQPGHVASMDLSNNDT